MAIDQNVFYTGTDTNNGLPFPQGMTGTARDAHFYIGRLGGELQANLAAWDVKAAKSATKSFAYWDLAGTPDKASATNWGDNQALAFLAAYHRYRPATLGTTLFFDVEPGNGGWTPGHALINQAVLAGALAVIAKSGYTPGIYCSRATWIAFFGAHFVPTTPFVLWLAGTYCPKTAQEAMTGWRTLSRLGGQAPSIWQYSVSGGGCPTSPMQDWNVTPYGGWQEGRWTPIPATAQPTSPTAAESTSPTVAEVQAMVHRDLLAAQQALNTALTALDAIQTALQTLG